MVWRSPTFEEKHRASVKRMHEASPAFQVMSRMTVRTFASVWAMVAWLCCNFRRFPAGNVKES
jgi:hypothetical protein